MDAEPFDPAEFLSSEDAQIEYLNAALETEDAAFIARSLAVVARARGVAGLAAGAEPGLAATIDAMHTLGLRLMAARAA